MSEKLTIKDKCLNILKHKRFRDLGLKIMDTNDLCFHICDFIRLEVACNFVDFNSNTSKMYDTPYEITEDGYKSALKDLNEYAKEVEEQKEQEESVKAGNALKAYVDGSDVPTSNLDDIDIVMNNERLNKIRKEISAMLEKENANNVNKLKKEVESITSKNLNLTLTIEALIKKKNELAKKIEDDANNTITYNKFRESLVISQKERLDKVLKENEELKKENILLGNKLMEEFKSHNVLIRQHDELGKQNDELKREHQKYYILKRKLRVFNDVYTELIRSNFVDIDAEEEKYY